MQEDIFLDDTRIGGPGVVVEINESKFGKRKYHCGHRVEGIWIVGGVELTPQRKRFLLTVPNRSSITLLDMIRKHIKPGSIVHTDYWSGHNRIEDLALDLEQAVVNHSREFIAEDGIHTNTVFEML